MTERADNIAAIDPEAFVVALRSVLRRLAAARKLPCRCSGFVIQYEGGCVCERGKATEAVIAERDALLATLMEKDAG